MSFINPLYLWAFTGLLLPIGIHLLSRKEGNIIKVGSLRHVEESNTSQFKSIRLNELLLLLSRCLMIALLVLFISGARCSQVPFQHSPKWLLLEKGLENDARIAPQVDTLKNQGYQVRYLSTNFPHVDGSSPVITSPNYWNLVEQLKLKPEYEIVVFSYNLVQGFTGKRLGLPANIRWIGIEPDKKHFIVSAMKMNSDSIRTRIGYTSSENTSFAFEDKPMNTVDWFVIPDKQDSVLITQPDTLQVSIITDKTYEYDARILTTALITLRDEFNFHLIIRSELSTLVDWLFWLSDKPLPDSISSKVALYKRAANHALLEQRDENTWYLTKRLDEGVLLKENAIVELHQLLFPSTELKTKMNVLDKRMMAEGMMSTPPEQVAVTPQTAGMDIGNYLLLLFVVVWTIERMLAIRKNQ
jgi:hypothetical protein